MIQIEANELNNLMKDCCELKTNQSATPLMVKYLKILANKKESIV